MSGLNKILELLEQSKAFEDISDNDYIFSQETVFDTLISPLRNICIEQDIDFEWFHGISKVVLYFNSLAKEYVVKIPFTWFEDQDFDECYPFDYDHCELECTAYENAITDGMEDILLKEWCWTYIQGMPVYLQKKADCVSWTEKSSFSPSKEEKADWHSITEDREDGDKLRWATDDNEWNINVCEYFGYDRGIKILNWLYDNVSDLHSDNLAYMSDGAPVVLDYSGVF